MHGEGNRDANEECEPLRREVAALRVELDTALVAAREAEMDAGRLRGELAEIRVQLGRARQEQEWALTGRPPLTMKTIRSLRSATSRVDGAIRRRIRRTPAR
jgi:hypothetical protein